MEKKILKGFVKSLVFISKKIEEVSFTTSKLKAKSDNGKALWAAQEKVKEAIEILKEQLK